MRILRVAPVALGVLVTVLEAQQPIPPGQYWNKARIEEGLAKGVGQLGIVAGQSVTIYPGVVVRKRLEGPNNASVHSAEVDKAEVDEITYVIDGGGTFITGGFPPDPNNRTAGIKGGEAHDVKPGDIIVVPAGTPHWFRKINGHVTIMEFRYPSARSQKK